MSVGVTDYRLYETVILTPTHLHCGLINVDECVFYDVLYVLDSNVTLDVEHRHDITKWAVSLDQYLRCRELDWVGGCNGAEQDSLCNSSVSMKFLRMSAFTSYTRQREMNCNLNKTDQWIAWSLSAAFTLVLIVSASINFVYNTVKARSEQKRNRGYGTM